MPRYALTIEFDGTPFQGLQRQSHGPSVQQSIEEAVERVTGEAAVLHSAGRTDTGVHALAMRSHVDLAKEMDPFRLSEAINAHLRPDPIAITDCAVVPEDWHARFSCTGRSYVYRILNRRAPPPVEAGFVWHHRRPQDAAAMAHRLVDPGDVILVKGSKGSQVSRVVDALRNLAQPRGAQKQE